MGEWFHSNPEDCYWYVCLYPSTPPFIFLLTQGLLYDTHRHSVINLEPFYMGVQCIPPVIRLKQLRFLNPLIPFMFHALPRIFAATVQHDSIRLKEIALSRHRRRLPSFGKKGVKVKLKHSAYCLCRKATSHLFYFYLPLCGIPTLRLSKKVPPYFV